MKQKTITINLSRLITKNIATRQAIKLVKDKISSLANLRNSILEISFANVEFISRSFADELLKLRKEVEKKDITFNFINTNNEIDDMLKIVSSHKAKKNIKPVDLKAKDLETLAYRF